MKQKLFEDLYNKVPETGNIAIFGACPTGKDILNDLKIYKPNVQVLGFIDNFQKGMFNNLPIQTLKEFVEQTKKCDLVIMSTRTDCDVIINCLDVYDIPVLPQTDFVSKYYRHQVHQMNASQIEKYQTSFKKILDIFSQDEDKKLYELLYKVRMKKENVFLLEDYFLNSPNNKYHTYCLLKYQYLEKINKQAVKTFFDVGFHDGMNVIAYNKLLPNLDKIHGFEVIYDVVKKNYLEEFIPQNKVKIIPFALGDCCKKLNFYINKNHLPGSFVSELAPEKIIHNSCLEHRLVDVITMDKYCEENNIKPDLIKMDIEGAEMSALRGGIKTIKECRPQLAISIYHAIDDFVDIPLYLSEQLENYTFSIGHYSAWIPETVLYAIPKELIQT